MAQTDWHREPLQTYRLDLASAPEDLTELWSSGTRRLFRKNVDSFAFVEDESQTTQAVELCAASYRRSGKPLPVSISDMGRFARRYRRIFGENPSITLHRESQVT